MRAISDELLVATDDGSYMRKGFVTDVLKEVIEEKGIDLCLAIGPLPMMRAVSELTRKYGVKTLVSLNPLMVDGTGMCGCCRVTVGGETKFTCVDGPEFDGHKVDFAEMARRSAVYKTQEKISLDRYLENGPKSHHCTCGGDH
jgi:ferredoxin--NADP+ reductase